MNPIHRAHDALFQRVHSSTLIYNTCWEDPRLDREMLEIRPDSRIVMITSAGCNALDYLLDGPAEIHAIDMNPRQNALLQLKIAMIEEGDHAELFRAFGNGARPGFLGLVERLAPRMGPDAREYWRRNHGYFDARRPGRSFYYRGASGRVAWIAMSRLREDATRLMEAKSLDEQRHFYERLRPALWNGFNSWLVKQPVTMAMMGVPRSQIALIERRFPGGLAGYVQSKMEHVLTRVPISDNYFWRVYATGRYTADCCPNYLRAGYFETLRARCSRVRTHTSTVSRFLQSNPGRYSHFVLLDHQDWLASHDTAGLREEWDLILANSRPGTRILMRSASPEIDFIPAAARDRLRFFPELTNRLHAQDRVGTYGSTLLAEVQ